MIVLIVLVTFITILISYWYALYYKYDRYLKQYQGPTPLPIIGHALHFMVMKDVLPTQLELQRKYGYTMKLQVGFFPPVVQTCDPKLLESILNSTKLLAKSRDYAYLHRWLGTGLLTSDPIKWKRHRKILTPAFHFQILEKFITTFNFYSDILVEKLKCEIDKNSTDIYPYITLCSLDIICVTSMGTAVNAQEDGTSEYVKSVKEMSRAVIERMLSFVPDFLYPVTSNSRLESRILKVLHSYTDSVISKRKSELQNEKESLTTDDSDLGIKERKTFLDLLLQYKLDGGDITDKDIREEVDTFMFEGHDTTASAMSFTLYCLANNPEVQQKSVDELIGIFGSDVHKPATSKDLHEMKYLEMVIKESLRLYPPVPVYGRNIEQDTEFNGGILPKNVGLGISAYGVHRNPEIYPDPEKFDPERFTQENQAKRSPYAYIPFSAGSRNCIGQRFAMLEVKSVVSKVLRAYKLLPATPEHKLVLVPELVLKSVSGVHIRLEERTI